MKVIIKRPGKPAEICELAHSEISEYIGGCFETAKMGNSNYFIICNDNFLYNGSKYNCTIDETDYFGNIFICTISCNEHGEYDLAGLEDKDIIYLTRLLVEFDVFGNASDFYPGDRVFDVCIGEGTVLEVSEKSQEIVIQYDKIDKPSVIDRYYGLEGLYKL